jgi:probable HAF family extracellular repeat protein
VVRFLLDDAVMKLKICALLILVCVVLLGPSVGADDIRYTVTDLGSLHTCPDCDDESGPAGINEAGVVVGFSLTCSAEYHPVPFAYRNGVIQALTTDSGFATAINESGDIAGYFNRPGDLDTHSFMYRDGQFRDLGGLPRHSSHANSIAFAMNNAGVIVGQSDDKMMLYFNGLMTRTAVGDVVTGFGINDSGTIVGLRSDSATYTHPFVLDWHGLHDPFGNDTTSSGYAAAVNQNGVAVGIMSRPGQTGGQHAFAYENGVLRDLGTLGGDFADALAINNLGQAVGDSGVGAVLFENGGVLDLNALVGHDENGWPRLHVATGINDRGQIVGLAYFSDRPGRRAFLPTPIAQEP